MADEKGREDRGVTLLVCMTCGKEVELAGVAEPASDLTCEKCGSQVFRQFDDESRVDEAGADFLDETGRDLDTDDPPGDVTRGDLHDLSP